jgi:hypothetical protein
MRQRAPVRRDGGKIDDQRAAGFGLRQRAGRFGKGFRKCHVRGYDRGSGAGKGPTVQTLIGQEHNALRRWNSARAQSFEEKQLFSKIPLSLR